DRHLDDLAGFPDDTGEIEPLPGEHGHLAQEASGAMDRDDPVLVAVTLDDRDRARLDDEEVAALVSLGEEHVTRLDLPDCAEIAEPAELLFVEAGKGAVALRGLGFAYPYGLSCRIGHASDDTEACKSPSASRSRPSFHVVDEVRDRVDD